MQSLVPDMNERESGRSVLCISSETYGRGACCTYNHRLDIAQAEQDREDHGISGGTVQDRGGEDRAWNVQRHVLDLLGRLGDKPKGGKDVRYSHERPRLPLNLISLP